MLINELTIGLTIIAFACGSIAGWFLRQPRTITAAPPDLERERTIAEARHQSLIEDIAKHLKDTENTLTSMIERQKRLTAQLRGESLAEVIAEPDESNCSLPPKDYSDSRGQLQ